MCFTRYIALYMQRYTGEIVERSFVIVRRRLLSFAAEMTVRFTIRSYNNNS